MLDLCVKAAVVFSAYLHRYFQAVPIPGVTLTLLCCVCTSTDGLIKLAAAVSGRAVTLSGCKTRQRDLQEFHTGSVQGSTPPQTQVTNRARLCEPSALSPRLAQRGTEDRIWGTELSVWMCFLADPRATAERMAGAELGPPLSPSSPPCHSPFQLQTGENPRASRPRSLSAGQPASRQADRPALQRALPIIIWFFSALHASLRCSGARIYLQEVRPTHGLVGQHVLMCTPAD